MDTLLTTFIIIKATRVNMICVVFIIWPTNIFFSRFRCRTHNVARDCVNQFYWLSYVGCCKAVNDVFIHNNRESSQTCLEGCLVRVTSIIPICSGLRFSWLCSVSPRRIERLSLDLKHCLTYWSFVQPCYVHPQIKQRR